MRYVLAAIGFIALIILVVVLILRSGPKSVTTNTPSGPKVVKLVDYINKNSAVQVTIDGPTVGEENHRSIQINVTPGSRTLTVYEGYDQAVLRQQSYGNSQNAYGVFLRALANLNFIKERTGVKQTDDRGACPLGDRYIYELINDGKDVTRLWTSSCSSSEGTYAGTNGTTLTLFQRQIPDYAKLTSDLEL